MLNKDFFKTYVTRAFIPAIIYCIAVFVFLTKESYTSIWILFLGNVLYMISLAVLIFISNRSEKFEGSPVSSTFSGHILSITGAAIAVILSVILYFIFNSVQANGEVLHQAPGSFSTNASHQMLFVIILITAFGNTVAGFFAALLTSFDVSKKLPS